MISVQLSVVKAPKSYICKLHLLKIKHSSNLVWYINSVQQTDPIKDTHNSNEIISCDSDEALTDTYLLTYLLTELSPS
jgi:hypothetical protein